jgi:hypothetical protein
MRTLGFRTHVLVVLAAAAGLAVALRRPWYGAAPAPSGDTDVGELDGPIRALWGGITRLGTNTGETGWHALGPWGLVLAGTGAVAALLALLSFLPAVQGVTRELLRYLALGIAGVAMWKLVDTPGVHGASELRYGAVAGAACALLLAWAGMSVAAAPSRRVKPIRRYEAPPPPPIWGSSGPPGS